MLPENLDRLFSVSRPAVHPDGWAVVSAVRPDFAADAYVGQLWRVPLDGGSPRRITRGFRDTAPRLSPDGRLIGFLRATADGPSQLAVVPAAGGEPMVITDRKLGVAEFAFTPDSSRVVFTAAVPDEGRYGTWEGVPAAAEDARHITTLSFQYNGRGYTADQRTHVFVVDLPDPRDEPPVVPVGRAAKAQESAGAKASLVPEARQLTEGDFDHREPVVAAGSVIVVSARHEGRGADLRADLYRIDLATGDATLLTDPEAIGAKLAAGSPVVLWDDLWFRAVDLGPTGRDHVATNAAVWRMPVDGGPAVRLTEPAELDFAHLEADPTDGIVLAVLAERGVGVPVRFAPDGNWARLDVPRGASVNELAGAGGHAVAAVSTPASPGEAAVVGAESRLLTDFAARLCEVAAPVPTRELIATSPDGTPVHGWVVAPQGDGPHPVLLNIHGGPFAAYGPAFFDEAQVYAAAGYAVVMCNPRGSAGYGEAHGAAIRGAFGDRDMVDVLAFLDHALATVPGLDPARVGVMGGSYGGYLTAWIIAHEHRFAAAIVERGYLDPRSFVGSSDIGWFFAHSYNTDDPATMDAQSPTLLAGQVTTPTLVIHSEQDLRCPLAQAFRYYTELKLAGVDAELLVFPGENHELSRSGRPWHRRQRFDAILEWWQRHLPV
ncbi:MAG: S9 family peptidase [Actinobacteria bacterium]|nr:S9 family peptidase [Actinomycetota bacterium]